MKAPQSEKTRRMGPRPLPIESALGAACAAYGARGFRRQTASFNLRGMERTHADTQGYLKQGGANRGHKMK